MRLPLSNRKLSDKQLSERLLRLQEKKERVRVKMLAINAEQTRRATAR